MINRGLDNILFCTFTLKLFLMKSLLRYWYVLTHIGVDSDMSYLELKRVHMVNLIALTCIPFMFFFSVTNFVEHRYILSGINFSNALFSIFVIVLQFYRKQNTAKIILLVSGFFFFFLGGLFYRNGGEYFLLCILIVSMLLYDDNIIQFSIGTAVIIAILIIHAIPYVEFPEETVPHNRALFNISSSLVFIVVAVSFFKHIIYNNMQQIEEQRLKLHFMNRDKEKVFSIVAHDMRSPLATLEGMVSLLHQKIIAGNIPEEYITQLQLSIAQQNSMLESLLQWSSSNMQGLQKSPTAINIKEIILDVVHVFELQHKRKELFFAINIDNDLEIYADSAHVSIIFRNLISNAIKFSHHEGRIEIYTSKEKERVYIHIKDYGIGMQKGKIALLFDAIQQRSVGTGDEPGAGLGLLLCKELIELNDGDIQIDSVPDKGSVFTIGFPHSIRD